MPRIFRTQDQKPGAPDNVWIQILCTGADFVIEPSQDPRASAGTVAVAELDQGVAETGQGHHHVPGAGVATRCDLGIRILGDLTLMDRSEEHTSELQSLMRISYAVFCLKKNTR